MLESRAPLAALALATLLAGCNTGGEPVAADRDPTLRGLADRLRDAGLRVGQPQKLRAGYAQKAALGRAVGVANELAGAGIRSQLATETQRRSLEGVAVLFERFPDEAAALAALEKREAAEARQPNPGCIVYLQAGDKLLTLRGTGADQKRPVPGAPPPRPLQPPDPEVVERIRDALLEAEGD